MRENETVKYKAAEAAFVEWFHEIAESYEDEFREMRECHSEFPSKERVMSEKFAKDVFYDYAYMSGVIENLVKGRGYE